MTAADQNLPTSAQVFENKVQMKYVSKKWNFLWLLMLDAYQ